MYINRNSRNLHKAEIVYFKDGESSTHRRKNEMVRMINNLNYITYRTCTGCNCACVLADAKCVLLFCVALHMEFLLLL